MKTLFEQGDADSILAVLDLAPAMVRGLDGQILYWTSGAEQLYGWAKDDAIGRQSHDLLQTEFPVPLEVIEAALLKDGVWHGTLHHRTRDGERLRVASHWALQRDRTGQPVAVAEVNTNIGLQAEAESARNRLAAIVQSSRDAIVGKTLDGIITDWNPGAEALFGRRAADVVGRSITLIYPPERVADEAALLERIRRGETIDAFQSTRRRRDGSDIPVAVTVSPIRDANGVIVGASTIMSDLRAWLDREGRLAEMQGQLAHITRLSELGQLVAALVHEVNQPLTAIRNYASGLDQMVRSGNYAAAPRGVTGIINQVSRADDIIRRLRDFVRRGAPTVQVESLDEIIGEAIELALINPAAKGVAIDLDLAARDARVLVDRFQIQQVLFNLLRNAIEAMEGREERRLTIRTSPAADGLFAIEVSDTGPGIAATVLGELFKPFVTTKQAGMGVGLSVSRTIVEGHGGTLTAQCLAGSGALFRLTLRGDDAPAADRADGQ